MTVRILQGDCREVLRMLADASVDSIVTDPPYHLTTGKKGGSTLKAAELEGFSAIGIELNPAYIAIAQRRIAADAPLFAFVEVA